MKFTIDRLQFFKSLQHCTNIIGSRTTIPILANVLITASEDGAIELVTTNFEIRITANTKATVSQAGKTTINARKLVAMLSKFTGSDVIISTDDEHHSEIHCGNSNFKINGLVADDFPVSCNDEPTDFIHFGKNVLPLSIDAISYAISRDDTRKVLHGVCFDFTTVDGIILVATDGKRLAVKTTSTIENYLTANRQVVIPVETMSEIKRIFADVELVKVALLDKSIVITGGDIKLESKLIEGTYPNYRQVIPQTFKNEIHISTAELKSKVELVSVALSNDSSCIKMVIDNNKLSLQATGMTGEGNDSMDIKYTNEIVEVSFNPQFIIEPLTRINEKIITLKFNDAVSPMMLQDSKGFKYVIMPMRNR
jgi:DNA polymerase-3 subunit beta